MQKINGVALVDMGRILGAAEAASYISEQTASLRIEPAGVGQQIEFLDAEQTTAKVIDWCEKVVRHCENLTLGISAKQARRIVTICKQNPSVTLHEFGRMATDLAHRLQDELSEVILLQVDKNMALYGAPFPFGVMVAEKIVSAAEDIQEAAYCLSLERWTACVFHLMRVMEIGVQQLGDKLGITLTKEKNWQTILDEVNKTIKMLPQRDESTKLLAASAAHLYNVKLAWRNEVMHPKATYTEQEAVDIFTHVKTFINDLALII